MRKVAQPPLFGDNFLMNETISLIIPTYNERDNITPLLKRLERALAGYNYEVVFIDDNSADGTAEVATSLADKYPVRVIVRKDKRGLASAVVDGLSHVSGKIIAVMDADLQHPPEVLPDLLKEIEKGADIVIASRYVKGGSCLGWSLSRKLNSRGAIFLAHLLLPATRRVSDPMSGFFMFSKEAVAEAKLKPLGYKILLEILIAGKFKRVAEVPYTFGIRGRGESKLSAGQQMAYLRHLFSLMKRSGELARFLKFSLVGISGVGVNMGLLWLLTELGGLFYLASAAIGIETSIITNFILNNYFTFADRSQPGVKSFLNRLLKFNMVSLAGLAINLAILWFLTEVPGVFYLLSNLVGIAAATLWNYLANNWWTWKP
ncbi:MAG: glycosyltransferase [Dehalococcoidales bacterium]